MQIYEFQKKIADATNSDSAIMTYFRSTIEEEIPLQAGGVTTAVMFLQKHRPQLALDYFINLINEKYGVKKSIRDM